MSIGFIWLAIIILLPLVALYFLKANAAPVFFGLCLGYVLLNFDSHNASTLASSHSPVKLSSMAVNLALLLIPALVTLISQIGSVKHNNRYTNLLPALSVGVLAALLIIPLMPGSIAHSIYATSLWPKLTQYRAAIVGVGALITILFFWLNSKRKEEKHKAKA